MSETAKRILLTCGETSGDHHAARLVQEMQRLEPDTSVVALGGPELERAGAEVAFRIDKYAFMGFSEIVKGLPHVLSLDRQLKKLLGSGDVDLLIPVDYPGLNLRLARYAKKAGVPVLYYISPQVWAWGGWRIRRMREIIDLMAVILPFEEEIYRNAGIPVVFAGHPSLDEIDAPDAPKRPPRPGDECTILLLPGSRQQEVERMLPVMLDAARIIRRTFAKARFVLGLAPLIDEASIRVPADLEPVFQTTRNGLEMLGPAHLAIAASGTITLQCAMSGTPLVVIYKTSPVTFMIGKRLVNIPHIAMPNVLAGREIIPELLQGEASAGQIANKAVDIMNDVNEYMRMSADLLLLRESLSREGGTRLVAEAALRIARGENAGDVVSSLESSSRRDGGRPPLSGGGNSAGR
jgi:lipid-A-disaccharide synthase